METRFSRCTSSPVREVFLSHVLYFSLWRTIFDVRISRILFACLNLQRLELVFPRYASTRYMNICELCTCRLCFKRIFRWKDYVFVNILPGNLLAAATCFFVYFSEGAIRREWIFSGLCGGERCFNLPYENAVYERCFVFLLIEKFLLYLKAISLSSKLNEFDQNAKKNNKSLNVSDFAWISRIHIFINFINNFVMLQKLFFKF